ncbi:membrane protein [Mycolicibacterium cyprinidarum]|nr:membrane protein [Mycolicibacterium sp. NGTWS1803]
MPKESSRAVTVAGLALAGAGLAHFAVPQLFEGLTKPAFPDNTRQHVYIDGGIETAVGLGLAVPQTRKLALVGLTGYLLYLIANVVRNR